MKKSFKYLSAVFVLLAISSAFGQTRGSRQVASPGIPSARTAQEADNDTKLAESVRKVTNRTSEGLVTRAAPMGGYMIDLQNRFQNVMLARIGDDGEAEAACVEDLGEANAFFGRDLMTGAVLPRTEFAKLSKASIAAQYGMSEQELDFYTGLIEQAKLGRLAVPENSSFTIQNADAAGEGFNDPLVTAPEGGNNGATRGQQRLNLFQYAAAIWGAFLDSPVTTVVNSNFDPLPCSTTSAVLGQAGSSTVYRDFPGAPLSGTFYHYALTNKLFGADANSSTAEINATFNSTFDGGCFTGGHRFYYGFDNTTPANRTNLLVVVLHELGHGLGFSSFVDGSTGAFLGGFPDVYSTFMLDKTTGLKWSQMTTNAQRQASALNNGNVFWDGPSVKTASGYLTGGRDSAGRVQLYTPATLESGSSISHFDTGSTPNLLMEPVINLGLPIDGDLTRQQLRDIGWFRDSNLNGVRDAISGVLPSSGVKVIGTNVNITWTNVDSFSKNVTIELSTDGGATYASSNVIATDIANTGSYSWTVPSIPATATARIRVREAGFADPVSASTGNFAISLTPSAASVPVSGRVTTAAGTGIRGARVVLTGDGGFSRTALTNAFGYYMFDDIAAGQSYSVDVSHKLFQFDPRFFTANDGIADLDFQPR